MGIRCFYQADNCTRTEGPSCLPCFLFLHFHKLDGLDILVTRASNPKPLYSAGGGLVVLWGAFACMHDASVQPMDGRCTGDWRWAALAAGGGYLSQFNAVSAKARCWVLGPVYTFR